MSSAIEIEDATVVRRGRPVLSSFSLKLEEGESACILGPNGSGKSTIVKLISGELSALYREPASVRLFGEERWELFSLRSRLGIVSDELQRSQARDESVLDTILSGFYGGVGLPLRESPPSWMLAKAREAAALLGLGRLLAARADEISSGEMRRTLVARALVHEPDTLLLDEPFASLDIAARKVFADCILALLARGHGLVLVTHELSEIPREIGRVVLVKGGRLFADGPKRELLRSSVVSELFGRRVEVEESEGLYRCFTP